MKNGAKKSETKTSMKAPIQCQICKNNISSRSCLLPCNHHFCQICISQWCAHSQSCPTCGSTFTRLKEMINYQFTGFFFSAKSLGEVYHKSDVLNQISNQTIQPPNPKIRPNNHRECAKNKEKSTPSPVRTPYRRSLNVQVTVGNPQLILDNIA